jgi:hypothetical protein
MRIVEYEPGLFDLLQTATSQMASRNLCHEGFVNHYYASVPWCKLHLLLSPADAVVGALGVERMPFRVGSRDVTLGFGTNYYSLEPGAGGFLFLHWMRQCDVGIFFGGTRYAHAVIRSQQWPYFDGIGVYLLNKEYEVYPGQAAWIRAAKWIARQSTRRKISSYARNIPRQIANSVSVREEVDYSDDLLPQSSPFELRFAPDAAYLNWRYNTRLPFARYRLFRILSGARSVGYVILNEGPQRVLVSQCDGEDPETLAWGVVLSLLQVSRADSAAPTVMLTCSHPVMQQVFRCFGFKADTTHPFALGSLRRGIAPPPGSHTSNWLVNYDWGDNGLIELLEPLPA